MPKLEGIIYKTFGNYVVLRGFAPIKDIAKISHKPESYQRNASEMHKNEIIEFLDNGEFKYFPEITLACRVKTDSNKENSYNLFISEIGIDNEVNRNHSLFVDGLKVLSERLPYEGYRARHASLIKNNNTDLVRVDGNHRLEPFDIIDANVNIEALGKLIVPYTVIFSDGEFGDKFEAGIFHNINFRQDPLRQESSLKIISDLNVFDDKEKLGIEYPLALNLIDKIKSGIFNDIHWLAVNSDIDKCFFRTACLKIAQLLILRKGLINKNYTDLKRSIKTNKENINKYQKDIEEKENDLDNLRKERDGIEIENSNFASLSNYRQIVKDIEIKEEEVETLKNKEKDSLIEQKHLNHKEGKYSNFIDNCENPSMIIKAIYSLRKVYEEFEEGMHGNIAMLVTMVYYSLLDKNQLNSFISWARQNGVNKITQSDDSSIDASENLINMFEQIFQSKKNEIFISMQFGDSQSELIYEKVVRAIEHFNANNKSIHLYARPIRIDRTIETSSIQGKIFEAIKSCSLIIADLSSCNINVYHEIGYAMGLAESNNLQPNMILLYKENTDNNKSSEDIDKFVGFNLRNLSQLRFRDYKQLVDGLVERLEKHYEVKQ